LTPHYPEADELYVITGCAVSTAVSDLRWPNLASASLRPRETAADSA
jgi:hypothetical protein